MSCRITGKICDAWSEFDGCGLVRCKFMEKKDGGKILNGETVTDRHQMTNADSIRAMSDEELCDLLDEWWCMGANNDERLAYADERLAWLQQSAAEEKGGADHA